MRFFVRVAGFSEKRVGALVAQTLYEQIRGPENLAPPPKRAFEYRDAGDGRFVAMKAMERLIKETNARYILLSYGSGGRTTKRDLSDIIAANGKLIKMFDIDYKRNVMSNMTSTNEWTNRNEKYKEYLFLIEK